jgi:hypothetical protein
LHRERPEQLPRPKEPCAASATTSSSLPLTISDAARATSRAARLLWRRLGGCSGGGLEGVSPGEGGGG